ncbi:MAG: DNA-directed RNA polymerase subunit N [Thaumarchaeota archaeon]|nr:DNA-directed RNA polymerase subunit N [Nitrososphaerota archaeon]
MLVPVRCFTCGSLVGNKYEEFQRRVKEGEEPGKVMTKMGVKRYCCRRTLLAATTTIDQVIPYYESLASRRAEFETEQT